MLVLFAIGAVAGMVASYARNLPDIGRMADYQPASATRIFARDGTLLASVYKENRVWVPLSRIPPVVREAFIANEDHNFYRHHGVDFGSIVRAGVRRSDASAVPRRLDDHAAARAPALSQRPGLDVAQDSRGAARDRDRALLHQGRDPRTLSQHHLSRRRRVRRRCGGAHLFRAQRRCVDAGAGRDACRHRRRAVGLLAVCESRPRARPPAARAGSHGRERLRHARRSRRCVRRSARLDSAAPSRACKAIAIRTSRRTRSRSSNSSLAATPSKRADCRSTRRSTSACRTIAQEAVTWGVASSRRRGDRRASSGARRASARRPERFWRWSAATDFSLDNQFNRAWQARRQPGSSFKIYDYTAAIDSGMPASTIIDDSPVSYPMGDGTQWSPMDDDNSYMGAITLAPRAHALAQHRRGEARRTRRLGSRSSTTRTAWASRRRSKRISRSRSARRSLPCSIRPAATQRSPNQGLHIDPTPFRIVKDSLGNAMLDNRFPQATDVVSAGTAYIMTSMFEDVINHGTGLSQRGHRPPGRRQDRHDLELPRCVVCRLYARSRHRGLARQRRLHADGRIVRRQRSRADLGALHESRVRRNAAARLSRIPSDEVAKVAGCGRGGYEYYLKGTEPHAGCGGSIGAYGRSQARRLRRLVRDERQPTVPPADARPPIDVPPLPTESPSGSPAGSPEPTATPP